MKTRKQFFAAPLALALAAAAAPVAPSAAPAPTAARAAARAQQYGPLERGYRTGYSDGYQTGWNDQLKRAPAEFGDNADYQRADRAYIAAYGSVEDYRDGYRQGFEVGYAAGYARRGFDSNVPPGLARRGDAAANAGRSSVPPAAPPAGDREVSDPSASDSASSGPSSSSSGAIRADTVLLVELLNRLSTDVSQRGDRFEARVVEPREFEGATVAGRLSEVQRPGKASGRAQLQLDFEQLRLPGGDWEEFSAQVVEVVPTGDDNIGEVDPEGGVRGRDSRKDDAVKVGAGAGIGAIIGAIAGGGKGAGIGAIIGASVGTAGVLTQRGKEIRLEPGQQLRIRATGRR